MKILIISRYYFPDIIPIAFRIKSVAEYLARKGHSVDVFCSHLPDTAEKETLNGVRIFRAGRETVKCALNPTHKPTKEKEVHFKGVIKKLFRDIVRLGVKLFIWPDCAIFWGLPVFAKLKKLVRENSYDVVMSVSFPFTSHLLAFKILKYASGAVWIADTQDTFHLAGNMDINNQLIYRKLNRTVERKFFNKADFVTVNFNAIAEKYAEIFPESAAKIKVIPHLVDLPDNSSSQKSYFGSSDKIRMVFIGTLNKSVRNPLYLLKLFGKLVKINKANNLELHFFGNIDDCSFIFNQCRNILNKTIFVHGVVSKNIVKIVTESADFLINIGNNTPYFLPSKIVEYAASRKPIINLSVIGQDTSAEFLRDYPASINLLQGADDIEHQAHKLARFIKCPPKINRNEKFNNWINTFKIEYVGRQYEEFMLTALENRKSA